jgi:hypothetical protein
MRFQDIDRNPSPKSLRQFAVLFLAVFGGMGLYRLRSGDQPAVAYAVIGAAVVVGMVGLAFPRAIRWLFVGWTMLAFPIGWLISKVVLALAYFSIFTVIATLFRLVGRDRLNLRRREQATYWTVHSEPRSPIQYFRQF